MIEATELLHMIEDLQRSDLLGSGGGDVRKEKGEVVFEAGEKGRFMYVVRSGAVDIVYKDTLLETVGRGGIAGEMALIEQNARRSATVVARRDSVLKPVNQRRFMDLVRRNPAFALEVMNVFARRIKEMNERLRNAG